MLTHVTSSLLLATFRVIARGLVFDASYVLCDLYTVPGHSLVGPRNQNSLLISCCIVSKQFHNNYEFVVTGDSARV